MEGVSETVFIADGGPVSRACRWSAMIEMKGSNKSGGVYHLISSRSSAGLILMSHSSVRRGDDRRGIAALARRTDCHDVLIACLQGSFSNETCLLIASSNDHIFPSFGFAIFTAKMLLCRPRSASSRFGSVGRDSIGACGPHQRDSGKRAPTRRPCSDDVPPFQLGRGCFRHHRPLDATWAA